MPSYACAEPRARASLARVLSTALFALTLGAGSLTAQAQVPLMFEGSIGIPSYSGEIGDSYESGAEATFGVGFLLGSLGFYYEYQWVELDCTDALCGNEFLNTGGSGYGVVVMPLRSDPLTIGFRAGILSYHAWQVGTDATGRDNSWVDGEIVRGFRLKGDVAYTLAWDVAVVGAITYSYATAGREGFAAPQAPPFGEFGVARRAPVRDIALRSVVLSVGLRVGPFGY